MDIKKSRWEESYSRKENFIFYPKDETVKFINRFVRKRDGINSFKDVMDFSKPVRGLDFGCGIGRQTILMREFGIDAYGLDISKSAISTAKELAEKFKFTELESNFQVFDGTSVPFENDFFDFTISIDVLDSMSFDIAQTVMSEIDRVSRRYAFISLISGDDHSHFREFNGEEIVDMQHEFGTVQSYYNMSKISKLLDNTGFSIVWGHLITDESIISQYKYSRYYIVLSK